MGHVDHGKTKLLDAIRKTNVVAGEAGGITQAIGAYQVATEVDGEERKITFIDTPGHEAFTAMRARGAKSTDIAVLVVAADDGVMPQTIEALNHALAAEVPIVVAVNKIDKVGADPTKVRGQLTEYGLVPEEYGGDTMFVDVSAITGVGLDELLEAVILTADAALDLRANPEMDGQGVAIEAHLDKGRGPVATVLVQRGTLHVGDSIVAGTGYGRVRALLDDHGNNVDEAPPSFPVQVLGLTAVPGAGDSFLVVDDDRMARQIAERRASRLRMAAQAAGTRRKTLDQLFDQLEKGETQELRLILKGDGAGSVEALEDALAKIDVGDEVSLRVIDRGVGAITETNVSLAAASNAVIVGFNVRPQGKATELADREGVDIRYYSVIYAAIDEIEAALKGMLKPIYEEAQLGQAEIREIFRSSRAGIIAGCMVIAGTIRRNSKARLLREGVVITETTIGSLRREKDDATEVREGFECGITLPNYSDIRTRRHHRDLRDAGEAALVGRTHDPNRGWVDVESAQPRTSVARASSDARGSGGNDGIPTGAEVADQIKVIVAEMLERRIKDPRLGFVTVTDVQLTGRQPGGHGLLHGARVRVGPGGDPVALASATGLIRSQVGKQLGMKFTPTVEFVLDAIPETAKQIDDLLARARSVDARVAEQAVGASYAGEADPYKHDEPDDSDQDDDRV